MGGPRDAGAGSANGNCVFCDIVADGRPAHVVYESPDVVAFLDQRPLFPGHTLVVPREHVVTLADLSPAQIEPLFVAVRMLAIAVQDGMRAEGSFVALNNVVSQSVPHLHVHVVPRRRKDGLRGFFWPRNKYETEEEMAVVAQAVRDAVARVGT